MHTLTLVSVGLGSSVGERPIPLDSYVYVYEFRLFSVGFLAWLDLCRAYACV